MLFPNIICSISGDKEHCFVTLVALFFLVISFGEVDKMQHPGGFYEEIDYELVPDKLYHGTQREKLESILEKGILAHPRGQGQLPTVSLTPYLDLAFAWGNVAVEVEKSKIPTDRFYEFAFMGEIAVTISVPPSAIVAVWESAWEECFEELSGDGWKVIDANTVILFVSEQYARVVRRRKINRCV